MTCLGDPQQLLIACTPLDRSRPKLGVQARGGSGLRRQHTGRGTRVAVTPACSWPLMVSWVTRRVSSSGSLWWAQGRHYCKAESCSAVKGLGGFGQCVNRGVEAVLAAPVGFVVGFGGHAPDQLPQVVCTGQ